MKNLFFIFTLLLFCCTKKEKQSILKNYDLKIKDTLKFKISGFNYGESLFLIKDSTFIYEEKIFYCVGGGGQGKKIYGNFKILNSNLKLIPKNIDYINYPNDFSKKTTITKLKYGVNSLKIKTIYQILHWENKKYLMSDSLEMNLLDEKINDYMRFADYYNTGSEPHDSGMYLVSENKDTIITKFDLNQIPEKWQNYFLKVPITAKIKSYKKIIDPLDKENHYYLIEINKGRKDKVYKNLTFYSENGEFYIEIDSVLEKSSYGKYVYDIEEKKLTNSTELRTKWK